LWRWGWRRFLVRRSTNIKSITVQVPPDSQRINQLWLVTYLNQAGLEVVAQAKLETGEYAPLIAADSARLESMLPVALALATARNVKMRLIKFTNRVDVQDIVP